MAKQAPSASTKVAPSQPARVQTAADVISSPGLAPAVETIVAKDPVEIAAESRAAAAPLREPHKTEPGSGFPVDHVEKMKSDVVVHSDDDWRKVRKEGAPDPNELVSIYHQGPAHSHFKHTEYETTLHGDGRVSRRKIKTWVADPGSFTKVPRWLADMWKKMKDATKRPIIVDPSAVGAPKGHDPSRVADLEKKNDAYEKRIEAMEKLIAEMQERHSLRGE